MSGVPVHRDPPVEGSLMVLENSEIKRDVAEAAGAFAGSFIGVFKRPVLGVEQLAGASSPESAEKKQPNESMAAAIGHAAGSITANALLFVGATTALGRISGIGKAAAYAVGGTLGFLEPTSGDQGFGTRIANAALGVGTICLLEGAPAGLGALKSKWLADTQIGSLIPESQLGRVAMANAGIGALNVQSDSYIRTGEFAGAGQTLLGSAIWAGTGAGAHKLFGGETQRFGVLREATQSKFDNKAPDVVPTDTSRAPISDWVPVQATTVRISDIGPKGLEHREMKVPVDSQTASIFRAAQDGAVRIETLVKIPKGVALNVASGFAVADGRKQVRVVTTNHLVTADTERGEPLDISIFDSRGKMIKGAVIDQSEDLDTSVLAVAKDAQLKPVKLSDRPIDEVAKEDGGFLFAGYPYGNQELTLLNAEYIPLSRSSIDAKISAYTAQEGICGSGCFSLADGTVSGMYKNSPEGNVSRITLAANIDTMIERSANRVPSERSGPVLARSRYSFDDPGAAKVGFGQILDRKFPDRGEPDFMHSHVVRLPVEVDGGTSKLGVQISYLPRDARFGLRPLVLDDEKLTGHEFWKGTKIPISDARLTITLNGDTPILMETVNDPHHVLQQSLNDLDKTGYLGNLKPTKVE